MPVSFFPAGFSAKYPSYYPTGRSGASFDPDTLFTTSNKGDFGSFSSPNSLYQDSSGANAVTTAGDIVRSFRGSRTLGTKAFFNVVVGVNGIWDGQALSGDGVQSAVAFRENIGSGDTDNGFIVHVVVAIEGADRSLHSTHGTLQNTGSANLIMRGSDDSARGIFKQGSFINSGDPLPINGEIVAYTLASAVGQADATLYKNGVAIGTITAGSLSTWNTLQLQVQSSGGNASKVYAYCIADGIADVPQAVADLQNWNY